MVEWTAYMDESGKDGHSDYFVLAGITGSPENMMALSANIWGFKLGLYLDHDPDTWELHAQNIMRGYEYQKNQGPQIETFEEKMDIFHAIVDIVCAHDITILGTLIANKKLSKKYDQDKSLAYATTILFERLEQFVHTKPIDAIRIVSDCVLPNDQKTITTTFNNSKQGSNSISEIKTSHITGIEYVDSQSNVLIQTADIIAYVINRYRNGDKNFESVFAKLTESGKTYGGGTQCPFTIS